MFINLNKIKIWIIIINININKYMKIFLSDILLFYNNENNDLKFLLLIKVIVF